jgi:hypothetical protein
MQALTEGATWGSGFVEWQAGAGEYELRPSGR